MTARVIRFPVTSAEPIQLVLALDGVGIREPKRRKRHRAPHPWVAAKAA